MVCIRGSLSNRSLHRIIKFCNKHGLSPSVKCGGFGVAGWAVGGDVVIDLSRINDVNIEPPRSDGSWTPLKDTNPNTTGKVAASESSDKTIGKRRREDDMGLRKYDDASRVVANFLHEELMPSGGSNLPSPYVRRKLESTDESQEHQSLPIPPTLSRSSEESSKDSTATQSSTSYSESSHNYARSTTPALTSPPESRKSSTADTTARLSAIVDGHPSTPQRPAVAVDPVPTAYSTPAFSNRDPFGYVDEAPPPESESSLHPSSSIPPSSSSSILQWGSTTLPPSTLEHTLITHARPLHPHAYVTFGAGKRQKEIDMFTNDHPLPAVSVSGANCEIPYHVPTAAHPVGSSIFLLAGFGFLSRLHGLSIDNLVEVEMVLADGSIVIANEKEHPGDLSDVLRSL